MIRCIHTGDVHIGLQFRSASFGINYGDKRRVEILNTFFRIIDRAKNTKAEFLIVAGDLFEDEYATISDAKAIINKINELEETNVIIVTGNHDYYHNKSLYSIVNWPKHVYIIDKFSPTKLEFDHLNTVIWGLSWEKKEYNNKVILDEISIDKNKINILVVHGDILSSSNYLPINKSELENMDFNYVALGHIHKPQFINEKIAYSGSPEPLDFGESYEHGIIEGTISKENTNMKFVPFSLRNFIIKDVTITSEMGYLDIAKIINEIDTAENRENNLYRVNIKGYVDKDLHLDIDELHSRLENNFNYIELYDNTTLDFDLDKLYKDNEENIIGMFIKEMKNKGLEDEIVEKALYYGLDVLLDEKVKL